MSELATPTSMETDAQPATYSPATGENVWHKKCSKLTNIAGLAPAHRANPGLFMNLPCHHCGGNHPVSEFTWEDGKAFDAPKVEKKSKLAKAPKAPKG